MRQQIPNTTDDADKIIFILLMLDYLTNTFCGELEDELKAMNVYRMDIKNLCNKIREKLKKNPSMKWTDSERDLFIQSGDFLENMEGFFRRTVKLENGYSLLQNTKHRTGDEIEIKEGKGVIEKIEINTLIKDDKDTEVIKYHIRMLDGEKQGKIVKSYL